MSETIDVPGIGLRGTGLMVPPKRLTVCSNYADSGPVWTDEEIQATISGRNRDYFSHDWINNQGSVGSCNGWAAAQALERARLVSGIPRVRLSGVALYSQICGGVDRGSVLDAGMEHATEHGIPPADGIPDDEWRIARIPQTAWIQARNYRMHACFAVSTERELASALAASFVCVVAVQADGRGVDASGVSLWGNGPGNHAVTVDGLRWDGRQYLFDMPNSWGLQWGDMGRAYLTWERHLSGPSRNHFFYAIRGGTDEALL